MLIDAHTHIYPSKIAQRAVESVRDFYGMESMESEEGTAESLLGFSEGVIDRSIVCSVAVKPATVESINTFIAAECDKHPQFTGLMAMHQDYNDPQREIERGMSLGLRGIKVHPDTQRVDADDPRMMDIYAIAEEKKLPVIIHTGDYRYKYSHPKKIREILRAFPNLIVDAAHFGGWSIYDIGADILRNENCFVDTSSSFELVGLRHGRELINLYGTDRVMFGSDFPMWSPVREAGYLAQLGLSDADYEKVAFRNAQAFLGEA